MPDETRSPSDDSSLWSFCFETLREPFLEALAADFSQRLEVGDVFALEGGLGMGKSCFARALLRARAQDGFLEVPSPTFTLVQTYAFEDRIPEEIAHFDLYRIEDEEEIYEIGLEESYEEGCALIEWPGIAHDLIADRALWFYFEPGPQPETRRLTLVGPVRFGARFQRLCEKRAFMIASGFGACFLEPIATDLSPRLYDRAGPSFLLDPCSSDSATPDLTNNHVPGKAVLMDYPAREPGPLLADGRLYDDIAHRTCSLAPMIAIRHGLDALGLCVPQIYDYNLEKGLMLWADFGKSNLLTPDSKADLSRYKAVVLALARLHEQDIPLCFSACGIKHSLKPYDKAAFAVELDVFLDHYWPYVLGEPCPPAKRQVFHGLWSGLLDLLCASEQGLVLRDVQNPNCFWLTEEKKIGFIDFQDCLVGPTAYDMSAISMDARVDISSQMEREMLDIYFTSREFGPVAREAFLQSYALCAAQRISKNLGAFARAVNQAGRADYLRHIPRSLAYLARTFSHPVLSEVKHFYEANGLLGSQSGSPCHGQDK